MRTKVKVCTTGFIPGSGLLVSIFIATMVPSEVFAQDSLNVPLSRTHFMISLDLGAQTGEPVADPFVVGFGLGNLWRLEGNGRRYFGFSIHTLINTAKESEKPSGTITSRGIVGSLSVMYRTYFHLRSRTKPFFDFEAGLRYCQAESTFKDAGGTGVTTIWENDVGGASGRASFGLLFQGKRRWFEIKLGVVTGSSYPFVIHDTITPYIPAPGGPRSRASGYDFTYEVGTTQGTYVLLTGTISLERVRLEDFLYY